MIVRRKSDWTGKVNEMDIPLSEEHLNRWQSGQCGLVQNEFPDLTADQREFLMTGCTPEEWDELFGEERE